jgi:hypothetical protein
VTELELEAEPRAPDYIGSIRVGGANGVWAAFEHVLASVVIRHGRDSVDGSIEASTASLGLRELPRADLKLWAVGAMLEIWDTSSAKLFTGTITDNALADDPTSDAVLSIVAVSTLEKAGRRQVRGHAWPAEGWGARAARILSEAGLAGTVQAPTPDVPLAATPPDDPEAGTWSQTDALSALGEILNDIDGTAFELGDGTIVVQALAARAGLYPMLSLDPSIVVYSPEWEQTLDVRNRIVLGYGYGADVGGGSVTVDDPDSQRQYDLRWTGEFTTGLADAATANHQALAKLDRLAWPRWSLGAVTLLEPQALAIGQLVELVELPASAPFAAWNATVEGWVDTIEGPDWTQDLVLADPQDSGLSLPWLDVPAGLPWSAVDPACRWADAYNLGNLIPEAA